VGCQLLLDALRLNTTLTAPNMFYLTKQGYTLWMPTIVERKQRRGKYVLEGWFDHDFGGIGLLVTTSYVFDFVVCR
jgi:hypothetical protein